ncbi:hypothetical protein AB0P15_06505 [Streptomyces sp. NPDC087917]|uniref:hypothetical protein n=1 Tax=unclassified Streptomyces TaxID=2593676 RepID=UPI003433BDF4
MTAPWTPLDEDVRRCLDLLLPGDAAPLAGYRAQLPYVRMRPGCGCGCPTVDLDVRPGAVAAGPLPSGESPIVASRNVLTPEGAWIGEAMLFARGGFLTTMEVCHWDDLGPFVPPLWRRLEAG